jgi:hypothetical protein
VIAGGPSEPSSEAVPNSVPVDELHSLLAEDAKAIELAALMQIHLGKALDMSVSEVWRRWFNSEGAEDDLLESRSVYETAPEEPMGAEIVGRWGYVLDPLDHTWVHPSSHPYHHNELSVQSSPLPDNHEATPGLQFDEDGVPRDGERFQLDSNGMRFTDYREDSAM